MKLHTKENQVRSVIAMVLIAGSFLSAFILSRAANQTELMWSAKNSLLPGKVILASDLYLRKVALPEGSSLYFQRNQSIINFGALREVRIGELIPKSALTPDLKAIKRSEVPISVQSSDSPTGIASGQYVNVYHVSDPHLSQDLSAPKLVLSHVPIVGVDLKNQNLGGNLALTLSVNARSISALLAATESGRLVLVRVNA